jgi:6-pyruvoyl tetrahydropterin synthase/QueD family protein
MELLVSKSVKWCMAHFLETNGSVCQNIHGHNFKLDAWFSGATDKETGMAGGTNLSDLKRLMERAFVKEWDHSLIMRFTPFSLKLKELCQDFGGMTRFVMIDEVPTLENMIVLIAQKIQDELENTSEVNLELRKLKLIETDTIFSELEL